MSDHELNRTDGDSEGWPERWRAARRPVPVAVRTRVLARVNRELDSSGSWSWLAVAAAALVLWIHASWGVSMSEHAPRQAASLAALEAHHQALIEAATAP